MGLSFTGRGFYFGQGGNEITTPTTNPTMPTIPVPTTTATVVTPPPAATTSNLSLLTFMQDLISGKEFATKPVNPAQGEYFIQNAGALATYAEGYLTADQTNNYNYANSLLTQQTALAQLASAQMVALAQINEQGHASDNTERTNHEKNNDSLFGSIITGLSHFF